MPSEPASAPTQDLGLQAFLGRQPIFDLKQNVYAYELLFRSSLENVFSNVDRDQATSSVIADTFFNLGMNCITRGKRASINFTRSTLLNDYALLLPKEKLIIEILEDVIPEPQVIDAVRRLKAKGYSIALDDYTGKDLQNPLFQFVDIIKIDFKDNTPEEQSSYIQLFQPLKIQLLAEKVETYKDFHAAVEMGYTLFQGFYFCKPSVITGKRVPESKICKLQLLQEVNQPEVDFKRIEEIIKHDVALSYKLLRYINSTYFGLRQEVTNIRQILVLLGQKNLKKWISLATIASLGFDKPPELIQTAIIRALFCERLAHLFCLKDRQDDLFLMGLFSPIDAMLDMPMKEVLEDLSVTPDIKTALLGNPSDLSTILNIVIGYETGNWYLYQDTKKKLNFDEKTIATLYLEAIKISEEFLQINAEEGKSSL